MNLSTMKASQSLGLLLVLCMRAGAFPTEGGSAPRPDSQDSTFAVAPFPKEPLNSSSISTTSSLLFKDKKPILTYLLGQPKKQGSVSSPAQLLSPDRYEFFTFDDDGQIVKKLMSVKEIQKIIANNEKGNLGEQGTPVEYYQILTVTPDVESIPSVSRINPNEPLFSIHDVIASVQNVLKSEMKIKQSQSSPTLNGTSYVASPSSDHFEILTDQPPVMLKVEVQKATPTTADRHTTTPPPSTFILAQEAKSEPPQATVQTDYENVATLSGAEKAESAATVTHIPVPLVSTPKPASTVKETIDFAASTYKVVNEAPAILLQQESKPLSLSDAHPGYLTNDSFLDMKPITVEQISRIAEPVIAELKREPPTIPTGNFVKIETFERNPTTAQATEKPVETSTAEVEIPITPDLAQSVSSVLWQIASENSMLNGLNNPTEAAPASTEAPGSTGTVAPSSASTTETPAQSRSTVKVEKLSESPLIALGNILIPQNRPRPFQKIPLIEKGTPEPPESRIEPLSPTTPAYELHSSPSSTVVILTESEDVNAGTEAPNVSDLNVTNQESSTAAPQIVVSVSPDAVVQSPEHVKPVTDKVVVVNNTGSQNQSQQKLEGVQVIQEANIGQIPRTTEFPGQVVKEIQRMEVPATDHASETTEESLTKSASNTYSTQLPYVVPEVTTVPETPETETPTEAESTEPSTEANLEAKTDVEQTEISPLEKVDITFVPMVIKTPSAFKQENLHKAETQDATTTEKPLESETETSVTEADATETSAPANDQDFESKELPESVPELKNAPTTTEALQRETVQADDLDSDPVASLKQNLPPKPHFGKPPKPIYVKPTKPKPQTETKAPKPPATIKPFVRVPSKDSDAKRPYENHLQSSPSVLELEAAPDENLGLEATVAGLDGDVKRFADLCNELAFSLWSSVTHNGLSFVRSVVVSPFAVTSLLAMVFLGARGPTSGQMNDILKLDDMVTFNPHLVFRNVTESLVISRNPGVATAAFVRELYSDKSKGKLLDFYKERVQQFYDGHVEEVNFKTIGDTLRRQTNHLVKRQTWGKITDFLRGSNLMPRPPLAAFSANIFQTDCSRASTRDRDGEMYFVILPASRLRRLVPIPAVVWREGFLAGYEPNLDATAVSINPSDSAVSTVFVLPGQQGLIAPGDTLARLEHHLLGSSYKKGHWSRLMRSLLPRPGLELQIPRLSHKSVINVTSSLQRMGLKDLFSADKADLTGLNGLANDLHLSDMLQVNLFSTCGEEPIGARHHSEVYPATPILRREKSSDSIFSDSLDNLFAVSDFEDPAISALPLELRPRQARVPLSSPGVRIPEPPRLRFDRPFLFFVRHNPTGLILHMGRFNPRLMP